jgi:antitoxin component YwqK of YwqJK toxin-antitoxin module
MPTRLLFLIFLIPVLAFQTAQAQKEVRTYYDAQKKHLQEVYFVSKEDEQRYIGKYQRYYENGTLMLEGNFDNGEKSGLFTEYHESGKLARKLNYVNGMRHGAVQVFDEDGKSFQKAY